MSRNQIQRARRRPPNRFCAGFDPAGGPDHLAEPVRLFESQKAVGGDGGDENRYDSFARRQRQVVELIRLTSSDCHFVLDSGALHVRRSAKWSDPDGHTAIGAPLERACC
jgi:hypothetical protein